MTPPRRCGAESADRGLEIAFGVDQEIGGGQASSLPSRAFNDFDEAARAARSSLTWRELRQPRRLESGRWRVPLSISAETWYRHDLAPGRHRQFNMNIDGFQQQARLANRRTDVHASRRWRRMGVADLAFKQLVRVRR